MGVRSGPPRYSSSRWQGAVQAHTNQMLSLVMPPGVIFPLLWICPFDF